MIQSFTFSSDKPNEVDKSFVNFCQKNLIKKQDIIKIDSYALPRDETSNDLHFLRLVYDDGEE